jgi:hypothetical protein
MSTKRGRGQKPKNRYFFGRAFELPSPGNAQKRDKKKIKKNWFWIFGRIFCKNFSTRFLNSHR